MKYKSARPEYTTRELFPKVIDGKICCPFCDIPHELSPVGIANCGTVIKITATQIIIPVRSVRQKKLICLKCKKGDGEMVMYGNGYIHRIDCLPEVKLFSAPPRYSRWAQVIYNLPAWLRKPIEKRTGIAKPVTEVDAAGIETGKTLGYSFLKV